MPEADSWDAMAAAYATRQVNGLRLVSWNLWFGGAEIDDGRAKQADLVTDQQADLVFLQECFGDAGAQLARACGSTIAQSGADTAILTNAPVRVLAASTAPYATAALVQSRIGTLLAWSVHLAPDDYGPYRAAELPGGAAQIFAAAGEQLRLRQVQMILAETERLGGAALPVVIAGDFNVPSPVDWTGRHRPIAAWPATQAMIDAGFVDAFRDRHRDPIAAPGNTWSPIEPLAKEPRDRIDFIFVRGLDVITADHLGPVAVDSPSPEGPAGFVEYPGRCRPIPDHRLNAFGSDHLMVRATVSATADPEPAQLSSAQL